MIEPALYASTSLATRPPSAQPPVAVPTAEQILAARALLRWSAKKLAEEAQVSTRTITRIERAIGVPEGNIRTLRRIRAALEAAGIEFIPANRNGTGGIGVRLSRQP